MIHGLPQFVRTSKQIADLYYVAAIRKRRDFKYVRNEKLGGSVLRVFLQQVIQHGPGLGTKLIEEVLPQAAQVLSAFPARSQRRIESDVAEQIERVGLRLVGGSCQVVEINATLGQLRDDF